MSWYAVPVIVLIEADNAAAALDAASKNFSPVPRYGEVQVLRIGPAIEEGGTLP